VDNSNQIIVGEWELVQDEEIQTAITNAATAQNTADGKIVTFFQGNTTDGIPTGALGDLWLDTDDDNHPYRAAANNSTTIATGQWESVRDATIAAAAATAGQAIIDAAAAQSAADDKIVTFFQGNTTDGIPTGDLGDLWIDTDDAKKLYRAAQNNSTAIVAGQWELVQDETIQTAIDNAATAQNTADNKIVTFVDTTPPTGDLGDLWIDSSDGNKLYRAAQDNSTTIAVGQWEEVRDTTIDTALTTAQAKAEVFYTIAEPSETGRSTGDVWVDTNNGNRMYIFDETQGVGNKWVDASDDNKNKVWRQADEPIGIGEKTGDLWYDINDDDRTYRYDGNTWVDVDAALTTAKQAKVFIETVVQTANFTAQAQYRYPCNTSSGSFTLTLPANPNAGDVVYFFDTDGTFDINNLTIGRNNEDIIALAEDMIVDVRYYSGGFQYVNATQGWVLI